MTPTWLFFFRKRSHKSIKFALKMTSKIILGNGGKKIPVKDKRLDV
jgi:hypothetical protein